MIDVERDPVYIVRTPAFDGPIELLLTLAQRAEVDLKAIPLATLTDDYLKAIAQDRPPLERLAAFLVIGARLVQLKAAGLMPEVAVGEEDDLQAWEDAIKGRLEEYKRFKELAESLMRRHASGRFTFAGLLEPEVVPQARVQVSLESLATAFRQVLDRLPPAQQVTVEMEHVSLADKLEELRTMLARQRQMNFTAVFRHARTRLEAVVTFLALLELIRIGQARVAQSSTFAEITVFGQGARNMIGVRDTAGLAAALEAVLFTLNRPVTVLELQEILQSPLPDVEAAAIALGAGLAGRGLFLQRHQDQLQLVTDPAQADVVRRVLRPEYPSRLSPAAYETLAIIAYRQPLTRARIEEIRGVNCEAVLESLEEKGLIEETGRLDAPGTPRLFGTTMKFLQILGLSSLDELPPPPQSGSTST